MWSFAAKLTKHLLVAAAVLVILLAIAVGGARLMFAQLPGYGEELTAWIADELGVVVGFERIDVRFSLRGPELSFRSATVAAPDRDEPFLRARRASVTLDPWAIATADDGYVSRLTLEDTSVTIVRDGQGRFELQGAPLAANSDRLLAKLPERVELALVDTVVVYRDRAADASWEFTDVELSLVRAPGSVTLAADAAPPAHLGARLELAVDGTVTARGTALQRWRLDLGLRETDLAGVAALLPAAELPRVTGRGDVSVVLESGPRGIAHASSRIAVRDFALPELAAPEQWTYDRVGLEARWTRETGGAWTLRLDDVALSRNDRAWVGGGDSVLRRTPADGGGGRWSLTSDFVRVEDLRPFLLLLPPSDGIRHWLDMDVRGDVRGVDLSLARGPAGLEYDVSGEFRGLGVAGTERVPGFAGLSGELRADTRSGRIRFASPAVELEWPGVFRERLGVDELHGVVVWRQGRDVLRVVSDDLAFSVLGGEARSSLELTFPYGGESPRVDVEAALSRADIVAAKRWLPASRLPEPVVEWLELAIQAGTARDVELDLYGPLREFPFDEGGGQFRVAGDVSDARIEFVEGWPSASDLDGRVAFVNAGFGARGSGRVLGHGTRELSVRIDDMRNPVLELDTVTEGPLTDVLGFLNGAPLVARQLGPELERLRVHAGTGRVDVDLDLPLLDFGAYSLGAELAIAGGDFSVDGFAPHASEVSGRLDLEGRQVRSDSLEAVFLDGPAAIRIAAPEDEGYRSVLRVDGESTVDAVRRQFDLPFANRVAGQTRWRGELWIPAHTAAEPRPFRVRIDSNLAGVALRFPAPLEKSPAEPVNLNLAFEFGAAGLAVDGNLGATRRFALRYGLGAGAFEFDRGAIRFGGDAPALPDARGVTVSGTLPHLDVDEWLALAGTLERSAVGAELLSADLALAELNAFGQQLGTSRFDLARTAEQWQIELDSEAVAGSLAVPRNAAGGRPQVTADMRRLYLSAGDVGAGFGTLDPRELPGITLHADQLAFGPRELGEVDAEVRPDALGLRLVSFSSRHGEMHVDASGSWLTGVDGPRTRLAVNLSSTQVSSTLEKLGFDPVIEGELADVTASVEWPGPPSPDWMEHVDGDVAVRVETGSMLDIEPGAGRVVGLMSILALPRRLALDFRDVFNKGFVFDEITGDFLILDGDAYTDNLKLTGAAAEIGVAGRTGLADHDYEQQAVVTAEPGNMLPTVGGLIGGPGVGAALLIFTRIFKEPLKGIGRAVYCITGSWDEPEVERLTPAEIERGEICAALPPPGAARAAGMEPIAP